MERIKAEVKNKLAEQAYNTAIAHGFWEQHHSTQHFMAGVICELAECITAYNHGKIASMSLFEANCHTQQPAGTEKKHWCFCFDTLVKDSVEDELADAYIMLLNMAGGYGYKFHDTQLRSYVVDENRTFIENMYLIMAVCCDMMEDEQRCIKYAIIQVERMAELLHIDLLKYVQLKMEYNQYRAYKHGHSF